MKLLLLIGCSGADSLLDEIVVDEISRTFVDKLASAQEYAPLCGEWELTPNEAELFFSLSDQISGYEYHHDFDTAPCVIEGVVESSGAPWKFEINGAAKGIWTREKETIYFGCKRDECGTLVMWKYSSPHAD